MTTVELILLGDFEAQVCEFKIAIGRCKEYITESCYAKFEKLIERLVSLPFESRYADKIRCVYMFGKQIEEIINKNKYNEYDEYKKSIVKINTKLFETANALTEIDTAWEKIGWNENMSGFKDEGYSSDGYERGDPKRNELARLEKAYLEAKEKFEPNKMKGAIIFYLADISKILYEKKKNREEIEKDAENQRLLKLPTE